MKLHASHALLHGGWAADVAIEVDEDGDIRSVTADAPRTSEAEAIAGFVVPGMPNVHSHAFQRAMAGLTERRSHPTDSFWTWRELMYGFAARITPDQIGAIAGCLYMEMLKAGYTSVAEFHYLHHDRGGAAYADVAETSERLIAAAADAGIAITHLPVLYAYSGFGSTPPTSAQSRFVLSADIYAALLAVLHARHREARDVRIGAAFHSLRAIDPVLLDAGRAAMDGCDAAAPLHIHIAEQQKEVDDCIAWCGQRPVAWLLDHAPVDERWCLVHATHLDTREVQRLRASRAVAGLCPTTEANLGDGIFPAADYLGGRPPGVFGVGSDSHITVSASDELRILEYGQRLLMRQRAVLASEAEASPGQRLFTDAARGGAQALGRSAGRIAPGCRADLVVLDASQPPLSNTSASSVLDAWIFAGDASCVRDVMVGGRWRIRDRHHPREAELTAGFRAARAALCT